MAMRPQRPPTAFTAREREMLRQPAVEFQRGYAWYPATVSDAGVTRAGDGEQAAGRYCGPDCPAFRHGDPVGLYPGAIREDRRHPASPAGKAGHAPPQ